MKFSIYFGLLFVLCTTQIQAQQPRASYGEICDKTTRCDSRASLTCSSNGTCVCLRETEMIFDTEQEKCVALSGERCLYTSIDTQESQEKRYAEKLHCVKNATCSEDGFCGCTPDFFENSEGMCVPKLGLGETCSKDGECDSKLYLVCSNVEKKCSCNATESIYDAEIGKCVGKVGTLFYKYGACVKNAQAEVYNHHYYKVCLCDERRFYKTPNGTCAHKSKYGGNCEANEGCQLNMICLDGKCTCNETDWIYDSIKNACVVKAGHSCYRRSGPSLPCVMNAHCESSGCTCLKHSQNIYSGIPGFIEKNGICYGHHGAYYCHPTLSPCLEDAFCLNRKCRCPYPKYQYFDEKSNTCMSKLYGPCSEIVDGIVKNFTCIGIGTSMECVKNDGVYECHCKKGYIESETGDTCTKAFGSGCTELTDCDQVAGLMCWNGTCTCSEFQEYDENENLCRSLVGGKCGNIERREIGCTKGAKCKPMRNKKLPGICRCVPPFEGNSDRRCSEKLSGNLSPT